MTIKVSVAGWEDRNYVVIGNEVILKSPSGLTGTFSKFADQVHLWCFESEIDADLVGKWTDDDGSDVSRWNIPNESHRTMFILKWQ